MWLALHFRYVSGVVDRRRRTLWRLTESRTDDPWFVARVTLGRGGVCREVETLAFVWRVGRSD